MANKYCNLDGTQKISVEYPKISDGFGLVEIDVNSANNEIVKINNDVVALDDRVSTIITTPTTEISVQEIIDARQGELSLGANLLGVKEKINDFDAILTMLTPYYARKNREYLGEVSRKLRYNENVTLTFYGDSNLMRSTEIAQTSCLSALNGAFNNRITRNNRAYAGDSAQASYNRWTTTHDGNISIICFGTNDSSTQYGYPDATKTRDYLNWMEKLITRELEWGKAVIILSPLPVRNDKRWETKTQSFVTDQYPTIFRADAYVFGNLCKWLAEKYSAPFIDSREIMSNYEDEIYADSGGLSLGDAVTYFGDVVHFTDEGLIIWGKAISSLFFGDSLLNKRQAFENTAFATRKGEDPFSTNINVSGRIKYGKPFAWAVGDNVLFNRALELAVANETVTYSFYSEVEDLVVYPNAYIFGTSKIEVTLDFGVRQPIGTLDESLTGGAKFPSMLILDSTVVGNTAPYFNVSPYNAFNPVDFSSGYRVENKGIRIARKGWHTITFKMITGYIRISGLRFLLQGRLPI